MSDSNPASSPDDSSQRDDLAETLPTEALNSKSPRRDPLYVAILLAVGGIAVWILLMPFVPAISRLTMRRFHLETDSFAGWAVQAPVPTMYNFANQYEIQELPEGLFSPVFDASKPRYINHFPSRVLTFANGRYTLLHEGQDRWLTFRSRYRGQTLVTKVHAKPIALPRQPDDVSNLADGDGTAAESKDGPQPWRFEWVRQSSDFVQAGETP